jgi:N-acetylmuramoyl-L-alanine amidase
MVVKGRRRRFIRGICIGTLAIGLSVGAVYAVEPTATEVPIAMLSQTQRSELEAMLTQKLQQLASSKQWFEDQQHDIRVRAAFDLKTGRVIIDLGEEYGPLSRGAEMEDLADQLRIATSLVLEGIVPYEGTDLHFGGKDRYYWFPEDWRAPRPLPADHPAAVGPPPDQARAATVPTVVLSAGHGYYYHYGFKDWRPQRDPSNGITEDFITPSLATSLATWLDKRSEGTTVLFARARTDAAHTPSRKPWWQMSARYHLQETYPDHPEIWHSLPSSTADLRERDEDIKSRPLFANYVGASAMISLHTNGFESDTSVSGARAYYATGRDADRRLGDNVLCYMKEQIHAQAAYQGYRVASQAEGVPDKGENNLANMPSVIIETGFHTNPDDAKALQDPVFVNAAMRGVEKGYRLYREGKSCETFDITSVPDISGPQDIFKKIPVKVSFKGNPQSRSAKELSVTAKIEVVSCPDTVACSGATVTVGSEEPGAPVEYVHTCSGSGRETFVVRYRTTLIDVDDIRTSPVEYSLTCQADNNTTSRVDTVSSASVGAVGAD